MGLQIWDAEEKAVARHLLALPQHVTAVAWHPTQPLLARQHKNNAISDWQRWRDVVLATYECA